VHPPASDCVKAATINDPLAATGGIDGLQPAAFAGTTAGNQDFGIQAELAVSATGDLIIASASSGDWIYLKSGWLRSYK
jgi:hypothetical protein